MTTYRNPRCTDPQCDHYDLGACRVANHHPLNGLTVRITCQWCGVATTRPLGCAEDLCQSCWQDSELAAYNALTALEQRLAAARGA